MLFVDLQWACDKQAIPTEQDCQTWVRAALVGEQKLLETELSVRIVEEDESQALNRDYRDKDKPTNVLSFPFENPPGLADLGEALPYLGDLVICADVVEAEARAQQKPLIAHWAHMIVHGTLHLQGYDHITEKEAQEMEQLETDILLGLGFQNPYSDID